VVLVRFVSKFEEIIKLPDLRSFAKVGGALAKMQLLRQGRLSVSAVTPKEWNFILSLAGEDPDYYAGGAGQAEVDLIENNGKHVSGAMNGEDSAAKNLVDDEAAEEDDVDDKENDQKVDDDDNDEAGFAAVNGNVSGS
jgi:EVE domain